MRLRRLCAGAVFLGTVLLLCGCSGSAWYQRSDGLAGSNIVYDQAIFRALEPIISVCGDPTLQPGSDHFKGEEFFLHNCATANGHDFTALTQGQANPDRLQGLAFLLGTIDQPLAARIPQNRVSHGAMDLVSAGRAWRRVFLLAWPVARVDCADRRAAVARRRRRGPADIQGRKNALTLERSPLASLA